MVIGEQPGDEEDLAGRPFVGPAGRLFDKALAQVGIDRDSVYVTNAVKHFKFEQRGRWRLHKNPDRSERQSCRKWLAGEIERVQPDYFVCLGVTAAEAMLGRGVRLMTERGRWLALVRRLGCGEIQGFLFGRPMAAAEALEMAAASRPVDIGEEVQPRAPRHSLIRRGSLSCEAGETQAGGPQRGSAPGTSSSTGGATP